MANAWFRLLAPPIDAASFVSNELTNYSRGHSPSNLPEAAPASYIVAAKTVTAVDATSRGCAAVADCSGRHEQEHFVAKGVAQKAYLASMSTAASIGVPALCIRVVAIGESSTTITATRLKAARPD